MNRSPNRQLASQERAVAPAAPAIPQWKTYMNKGSKATFSKAEAMVEIMAGRDFPWATKNWEKPMEKKAGMVPMRKKSMYCCA